MGIISVENTDRLYWLGRYTERVYSTIKIFESRFDSMIDVTEQEYLEFCKSQDIPNIYRSRDDFARKYCFSLNDENSIFSNLMRAYDNAIVLREEIGSDTLSYIQLAVYAMNQAALSKAPLIGLQKVTDNLVAFWGMADDDSDESQIRNRIYVGKLVENYPSDHLSVYALTLEEGTPLYKCRPHLPSEDEQYEILDRVWKYLSSQGYEHYEVSNFARDGKRCKHNCRYWAYEQYLGLGPAAASTAFSRDGSVHRFCFGSDVDSYVSGEPLTGFETEDLDSREAVEELVLMGLRYKGGLDLGRLETMARRSIDSSIFEGIRGFRVIGNSLVPDDTGLMTADAAASAILDALY